MTQASFNDIRKTASTGVPSPDEVVTRLAAAVAVPLTHALERVSEAAATGRMDRDGLRALHAEIDAARRAGLIGQQISRFMAGQAQASVERVALRDVLEMVLSEHASGGQSSPTGQLPQLQTVNVMGDTSLVHTVLRIAAEWAAAHTASAIDWGLDLQPFPARARVWCSFRPSAGAAATLAGDEDPGNESLDWLVLRFASRAAGVQIGRTMLGGQCRLMLEFPHPIDEQLLADPVPAPVARSSVNTAAPTHAYVAAGSQVLVLASRRDLRHAVRDALRGQDLFIDYAADVSSAREHCVDAMPQVLIFETGLEGDAMESLRELLMRRQPGLVQIEIAPIGNEVRSDGNLLRVGEDGMAQTLPGLLSTQAPPRRR